MDFHRSILFAHPSSTLEDKREVLLLYLSIGDVVTFRNLLNGLSDEERNDPDVLTMAVRFSLARNNLQGALQLSERLGRVRQEPGDLLLAADVLSRIAAADDTASEKAQTVIDLLFDPAKDRTVALAAFSLLRQIPPEKRDTERFADAGKRLDLIEESLEVPTILRLLVTELEMTANPESRDPLIDGAVARLLTDEPEVLGEWLLGLGQHERLLEKLPEERARSSAALFGLLVRATMMAADWETAEKLLAAPHPGMKPSTVYGMRGIVASQQGSRAASLGFWERAFYQAELAPGRTELLTLGRMAARTGNAEIRNRAVTEALKRRSAIPMPLADVSFLFSELSAENKAEDFLEVSRNLLASQPENPMLINNVLWLELIGNQVRQDLTMEMQSLVERFPDIQALRSTLALAQVVDGDAVAALDTLGPILEDKEGEGEEEEVEESNYAVLALALMRNGEVERAKKIAAEIEWSKMMEVERTYFQREIDVRE